MSGELNLITLKAVQKERVQRYDSARALSDDIERFLDSRPVKACPPTFAYRFRKYAVKHRSAVAAAAALTIAIFGGAAATLWQARTAIRERAIAVAQRAEAITQRAQALRERGRAETEATRATELEQRARDGKQDIQQLANAMLFQLDDQLKDTGSLAARTTLLNLGVQYLQKADSADPNLGAAYFRVAELQESLRDTERAEASYRRSAELLRQRLAGDPRNMEARRLLACDLLGLANLDETYEGRNARLREAEAHLRSVLAVEPGNGRAMLDLSRVLVEEGQPWPVSMSGRLGSGERSPEEAVRFALQGSQADHNKPSDLLVLAEAQEAMSNWVLTQRNAIEDIHWLEEAVSTLDGATRQEPSNTKALVGLSVALLKLARHLRDRDEQEKSLAAVNRAVETARQAVAIDPQNPSVRIQAARSLGDLANFSSRRRGIEQYRAACAEVTRLYREQMAAHPDVVQHRVDFAGWLLAQGVVERAAENGREYLNFAQKGVEELREVDRKRPGDLRIRSILAAFLDMVSEAHVQLREYPQARAVAEESVALERALVRQSPGAVTSLKLTAAEGRLATALKLMGQTSAAIEQLRASSAIFRSMRDLVRKDRLVLFAASIAQAELASLYASQRNWAGQLAAIQELSEVLHAKYAENPYEPTVAVALSRSLYGSRDICMQRSELEKSLTFSRQLVDIAQKVASANPRQPSRVSWLEGARIGLLFDLGQAGLRDEALAVNREAAAAIAGRLAGGSSQNEVVTRNVDHAVDISRSFAILDEPAEALRLGLQAIPVAEQLAAKDPNNQAYVNRLLSVLFDTGSNAWFSGDIGKARGLTTREIQIRERSPRTSEDFNLLAQRQQQLAFFEEHMEKAAAAREGKSALENYGRSYAISERTFAESKGQSLADLENMRSLRVGAAFTMELLGQLDAARKSAREALQIADRIVAAQNSAPNHDLQNITRALLFRLMELTGSSDAEFQRFSGNSAALTPQSKQTLIAEGWLQYVTIVWQYPDRTVPAARRAVDGFRAVLRDGGPAQQRIDLARALCSLSYESRSMAHFVPPAEQVTYLEKARLASQEALGILEPLRAAGKLPEVNQDDWAVAKIGLASSESKLAAARGAATVSSR